MSDGFDYRTCPLTRANHIRLLTIHQGFASDPIECTLTTHSLTTQEPSTPTRQVLQYEALSYYWGSGNANLKIRIYTQHTQGLPGTFPIKSNLHAALNQLRLPDRPRELWIDAICINQDDDDERSTQVSLMADIYSKATSVCVWLGEASPDSNLALNFISRIVKLDEFDSLVADQRTPQEWAALSSLMRRPWFSRRWVVQEIALAPRAILYCGNAYVDWAEFADAVALFEAVEEERTISQKIMKSELFDHIPDSLGEIKFLEATRLVDTTNKLFRRDENGQVIKRLLSLETLISDLSAFKVSRPHDNIYAVLNLAKDMYLSPVTSHREGLVETQSQVTTEPQELSSREQTLKKLAAYKFKRMAEVKRFTIDYKKPFLDVCKDFLQFTIKSGGFLDILCRPWVPENSIPDAECPSWLLTTSRSAWRVRPDGNYIRANADTLVGPPASGKRNYNASGSFVVPNSWKFGEGPKARSMYVEGFVIDKIKVKRPYAADENNIIEILTQRIIKKKNAWPPDKFWRTLVADRGPNATNPPSFYPRAFKATLNQSVKGGHISTSTLVHHGKSTIIAKFLRRVQEVVWMRRLVITQHEALGLAPEESKKRDLICILYGCSVPVALRPMIDPVTNEEYFAFIGECYVHGIMDGEAFELARSRNDGKEITKKVFELR